MLEDLIIKLTEAINRNATAIEEQTQVLQQQNVRQLPLIVDMAAGHPELPLAPVETPKAEKTKKEKAPKETPAPVVEEPAPALEPEPEPVKPAADLPKADREMIRSKIRELYQADGATNKPAVRSLLERFSVGNVSSLEDNQTDSFYAELLKL